MFHKINTTYQTLNTSKHKSPSIKKLRNKLEHSSHAKAVITKIKHANVELIKQMDEAKTEEDLIKALSAWETKLDKLSQNIPTELELLRTHFAQVIDETEHEKKGTHFHAKLSGHEHVTNRVRLLMQYGKAIKDLYGYDSTTGLLTLAIVVAQTSIAAMMNKAPWSIYLSTMALVGSILNHTAAMAIHEASHNLAAPSNTLNRLVSILGNLVMGVPHQANFERYHMKHHLFLGQPGQDNDLPAPELARWVGNSSIRKAIWLAFYPLAYAITQRPERPTQAQIANVVIQLAWDAGILYFLGPWAFTYLLGSTLLGTSALNPVSAHWIDEHFERDEDRQETHSYYGWLNIFNFNVGYHNEHHDFPNIPGSRLPKLHEIAKDHYGIQKSGNSWLWSIWQFITDPNISGHSRIIRTPKAQHKTNKATFFNSQQDHSHSDGSEKKCAHKKKRKPKLQHTDISDEEMALSVFAHVRR